MRYLPDHVRTLSAWIDLAEQVVVVDSFSGDGTVDFIRNNLRHPNLHFVAHPPGLYASWNHGIRQMTTEYCYISTVGDSISRVGIEHLVSTASRLGSGVLVSRPDFVNEVGQACDGPEWPMDDVVRRLQVCEPCRLRPPIMVATALTHTGGAITGSCASDLFETTTLQNHPFPLDFGVAGDGIWSLENVGRIVWAVTPEVVTTFRRHPPTSSAMEIKTGRTAGDFARVTRRVVAEWLQSCPPVVTPEVCADIQRLLHLAVEYEYSRCRYNRFRKGQWPWILNPRAWLARTRRNALKSQVNDLMQRICDQSSTGHHLSSPRRALDFLAVTDAEKAQRLCLDHGFSAKSPREVGYA